MKKIRVKVLIIIVAAVRYLVCLFCFYACFYICIFMDTWISDYKVHSKARVRIITEGLDIAMLHWMAT